MQRHSFSGPPLPSKPVEYTPSQRRQQQQQSRDQQFHAPLQQQHQQPASYYDDHRSEQYFRDRLQQVQLATQTGRMSVAPTPGAQALPRPRSALPYQPQAGSRTYQTPARYAQQDRPDQLQQLVEPLSMVDLEARPRDRRQSTGQQPSPIRTMTQDSLRSSASSNMPLSASDANSSLRTNSSVRTNETARSKPPVGRIARKPVVMDIEPAPAKATRKYYSPNDLDRLIPRKEVARNDLGSQPLPSDLVAQQREEEAHRMVAMQHQSPRPLPSLQTDARSRALPRSPRNVNSLPQPNYIHPEHLLVNLPQTRGPPPRQNSTPLHMPVPPLRQNSIPLQMPVPPPLLKAQSSPEALSPHVRLQPAFAERGGSVSPEQREHIQMRRSMPLESSLAHSHHSSPASAASSRGSPERLYRHPISELESFHHGRIPSPDRSTRFPDVPYSAYEALDLPLEEEEPVRLASIPPESQARRGRGRGESVIESDLPAMPPLFEQQTLTHALPSAPLTHSPTRTGTGFQSPVVPLSPKKLSPRGSPQTQTQAQGQAFGQMPMQSRPSSSRMAHDPLQSIRDLPVEPIKRPALCLEERFHPATYVKTSKFKIKVKIEQVPFVAGGEIFGYVEVSFDEGFRAALGSTQVLVGEIGVEVLGCEEISHPESGHEPRSLTFLFGKKIFQERGDVHPDRTAMDHIVTSAVTLMPGPDADGFRIPGKGTTAFPFAFTLPVDAPSSADLSIARIRYTVTGYATVKLQGSAGVVATTLPVRVVEAWDIHNPVYALPVEASQGRDIANYNEVHAKASLPKSLFLEGDEMYGHIRIANHGARKIREVKFYLMNRITFFGDQRQGLRENNPPDDWTIDSEAATVAEPHLIVKGAENTWQWKLEVPEDRCLTIRNTALFEVTPYVLIKISTGPLFKSVKLALPSVCIADRASMIETTQVAPTHKSGGKVKFVVPNLYKYQRIVRGEPQLGQMGEMETTALMVYVDARLRVQALSSGS